MFKINQWQNMSLLKRKLTNKINHFFNSNDRNVPLKDLLLYAGYKGGNIIVSNNKLNEIFIFTDLARVIKL